MATAPGVALTPRFQLHLGERAHPGRAALGTFDCDSGPCLALTGAGNRVSLHPLHEPPGSAAGSARVLAAAGPVTALAAGPLLPGITTDILFIGTATSLHAYDVSRNRDVFFIDVPDGVTCLAVVAPSPPGGGPALVLAGGTCALAGFDASGKEVLWAAAGGRVLCVAAADAARGGGPAILAGCDDADIRGYDRGGSLLFTLPEADAVVALAGLHGGAFAYALANGTVGVYRRGARAWRVKSKHAAAGGLVALDLGFGPRTAGSSGGSSGGGNDCDVGCVQLVAGWASGRVEVRDAGSGDVLARDHMAQRRGGIVALFATASLHCMNSNTAGPFAAGDGCSKGSDATSSKGECGLELLTLGGDGELRGYGAARPEMAADGVAAHCPLGRAVSGPSPELCAAQAMITELARKRAEALRELTELSPPLKGGGGGAFAATGAKGGASNSSRRLIGAAAGAFAGLAAAVGASAGNNAAAAAAGAGGAAAIPPQQAPVEGSVTIDRATLSCQLTLTATSADAVIRAAVVFGEQVFSGESHLAVPTTPGPRLVVPLSPARDAPVLLMVRALVGPRGGSSYRVCQLELALPKHVMYVPDDSSSDGPGTQVPLPDGHVEFTLPAPVAKLGSWLEARFAGAPSLRDAGGGRLEARLMCLRSAAPLAVQAVPTAAGGLQVTLRCTSMALAGELLQDLAAFAGVSSLESVAKFPGDMAALAAAASAVDDARAARMQHDGGTAAGTTAIKDAVVRSEDARILGDMTALRKQYRLLMSINRELQVQHSGRSATQAALMDGLRAINVAIQQAAQLRVGAPQARVVAACRTAVKACDLTGLPRIMSLGAGGTGGD